jgi:tetratricopeptide (TPR) repeat protein/tRNA A-37 threonylcarbamoyl transferase component Bud32
MRRLKSDPPDWAFAGQTPPASQPEDQAAGEGPSDTRQQRRIHGYRIREQIAAGPAGTLLKAVDKTLGRTVTLKVFRDESASDPARRAALEVRARAIAGLRHENLVSVYEVGNDSAGYPFLAMEYIDGEPLDRRLRREGPLPPHQAARLAREAALGLQAAHDAGLIHGNIKPSNIFVDARHDRAKLTDFGLTAAEQTGAETTTEGPVSLESFPEAPGYMSPEQIRRPPEMDGRSDVYSLGAVLYEMLTGEKPFRGVGQRMCNQVVHDVPVPPRQLNHDVPRDLETICLRALAKQPQQRYSSAANMAEDLWRWLSNEPILAEPTSPLEHAGRWYRRNWPIVLSAAAVLSLMALIACAAVFSAMRTGRARDGAVAAHRDAVVQRDKARQTAEAAIEQRKFVVDALYNLVDELQDELQRQGTDSSPALETGLQGLRELAESADASGVEDLSTVAAHLRLGQVLFRMRRLIAANRHIAAAERLLTKLRKESPDDGDLARMEVELRLSQGELAMALDNIFGARRRFDEALELSNQLVEKSPQDDGLQRLLASAHDRTGKMALVDDDPRKAQLRYMKGLEIHRRLTQQHPDDPEGRLTAVLACIRMGDLANEIGLPNESRQYFEEAVELAQPLEEDKDYQGVILETLLETHAALGDLVADEEPQQAAQYYREMIRVARQMLERQPASEAAINRLSFGLEQLAKFYEQEEDLEKARDQLAAQQDLLTQQLAPAPDESRAAQQLVACLCNLGDIHLRLGDLDAAGDSYEDAINLLNRLISADAVRPAEAKVLAQAAIGMAEVLQNREALDEVEPWLTRAENLLDELDADESGENLLEMTEWIQQQRAKIAEIREAADGEE